MPPIKRVIDKRFKDGNDLLLDISRQVLSGELSNTAGVVAALDLAASGLEYNLKKFITADPAMLRVKDQIRQLRLLERPEPVLITGPSGTGKEILANALEEESCPFVAENCAAIPEELAESIFFGHKKGAFTGAFEERMGLLEEAGDGVIFLDEIGDMSLKIQAKFLRAIQDGTIRRVGSTQLIRLRCRFVAATKQNLEELVDKKLFREDLFARIMTFEIKVTGLRERPNDIPLITKGLMSNRMAFDSLPPFPQSIQDKISRFNVRAIETALARWETFGSYD